MYTNSTCGAIADVDRAGAAAGIYTRRKVTVVIEVYGAAVRCKPGINRDIPENVLSPANVCTPVLTSPGLLPYTVCKYRPFPEITTPLATLSMCIQRANKRYAVTGSVYVRCRPGRAVVYVGLRLTGLYAHTVHGKRSAPGVEHVGQTTSRAGCRRWQAQCPPRHLRYDKCGVSQPSGNRSIAPLAAKSASVVPGVKRRSVIRELRAVCHE